jgi:hypothetical protein
MYVYIRMHIFVITYLVQLGVILFLFFLDILNTPNNFYETGGAKEVVGRWKKRNLWSTSDEMLMWGLTPLFIPYVIYRVLTDKNFC